MNKAINNTGTLTCPGQSRGRMLPDRTSPPPPVESLHSLRSEQWGVPTQPQRATRHCAFSPSFPVLCSLHKHRDNTQILTFSLQAALRSSSCSGGLVSWRFDKAYCLNSSVVAEQCRLSKSSPRALSGGRKRSTGVKGERGDTRGDTQNSTFTAREPQINPNTASH